MDRRFNRARYDADQTVATFAAKQWKHWNIGDRHFLGLAQGVVRPGDEDRNRDSIVYEWDGSSFVPQQQIPSRWAYNWHPFRIGDEFFVAHADHAGESVLYRWDGTRWTPEKAPGSSQLVGLWGNGSANVYAAGAGGLVNKR